MDVPRRKLFLKMQKTEMLVGIGDCKCGARVGINQPEVSHALAVGREFPWECPECKRKWLLSASRLVTRQ